MLHSTIVAVHLDVVCNVNFFHSQPTSHSATVAVLLDVVCHVNFFHSHAMLHSAIVAVLLDVGVSLSTTLLSWLDL